jgi:hypothetical protein
MSVYYAIYSRNVLNSMSTFILLLLFNVVFDGLLFAALRGDISLRYLKEFFLGPFGFLAPTTFKSLGFLNC